MPLDDDRPTILIVDDQLANRDLVRAYLSNNYLVLDAADGPQALELLSRESVDLVLLDVMMPQMSGIEVCNLIKQTTADGPYQPVILLTALGAQEDRNHGLEAGADDFLTKPVDRRELLLRVKTFVKLRKQDEQIRRQVADLRRMEHLVRNQLDELRGLDLLKDDLVSMMVHDLKNPLTGIVGFLDVVRENMRGQELHEDALQALQASDRLREILDDVLRVRMLESGVVLRRELLEADTLVRDAVKSLAGAAKARQVSIAQLAGPASASFAGDRKLVLRAIENLLSNALKYSPTGAIVETAVRATGGRIEIEIADRGKGIPDDLKRRLFEKFGSLEEARGESRRGVGLGLYLVRLVATAHGGSAVVRDREGGGTSFALLLPPEEEVQPTGH